ncbi:glycosyl hydrolase [Novosphingobium sp. KA1]|nr:glycosyl hydrolase [Novosphingobium sp. KA1]
MTDPRGVTVPKSRWLLLAVPLALCGADPAIAGASGETGAGVREGARAAERAGAAAAYLDAQWGRPGGWNASENWQRFVIVDALLDYQQRTGERQWSPRIAAAVRNREGLYLNDDALWAVIASVHAWQVDRDPALLDYAGTTFGTLVTTYWDDRCGGGIWWDPKRSYKNAITNELLFYAATQLYLATGQAGYRDWALRSWQWFRASSMIGADGLVNDGLDGLCRNNGQARFTYNQGVLIGALNDLTAITGDPQYRGVAVATALAATRRLSTPAGILREPVGSLGADGLMFKGVFAYHLGHLLDAMPDSAERRELARWTAANAEAVWRLSAAGTRGIAADWSLDAATWDAARDGQTATAAAAAQVSGLAMLLAAMAAGGPPPRAVVQAEGGPEQAR